MTIPFIRTLSKIVVAAAFAVASLGSVVVTQSAPASAQPYGYHHHGGYGWHGRWYGHRRWHAGYFGPYHRWHAGFWVYF